jgi:predicted Zn-dependent protease
VFGDVTSLSKLSGAAPALLQARYSRDMEREADVYARDWLNRHSIRQQRFDDLLCRLAAKHNDERDALNDYFASHPAVSDRAHCQS